MENTNQMKNVEIHIVCKNGDWEKFQLLVENGTDLKLFGENGTSCLHYAAQGSHLYFICSLPNFIEKSNKQKTKNIIRDFMKSWINFSLFGKYWIMKYEVMDIMKILWLTTQKMELIKTQFYSLLLLFLRGKGQWNKKGRCHHLAQLQLPAIWCVSFQKNAPRNTQI